MKRLRQGEGCIGISHIKDGMLTVRPLFDHISGPFVVADTPGIEEGDIVRAWGEDGDVFVQLFHKKDTVMYRYFIELDSLRINPFFPADVLEEVKEIIANPGIDDPELIDFTSLPFVTIDNEGSKDLDQAVYVEKNGAGHRIFYAIADASYYIKPGSPLFREAIRRGASYYFPDYSVPMLPRELSEGIVSLNDNLNRRALLFIMEIDSEGICVKTEIVRARIMSRAKLSYSGVQEFYDNPANSQLHGTEYANSLMALQDAGRLLAARGDARGVINYERFEQKLRIADDGINMVFEDIARNDTSRWNEQMSLLCNMEGAKLLSPEDKSGNHWHTQPVFRIHGAPDDASLDRLEAVISSFIEIHSLDRERWQWRKGESLSGYLKKLPLEGPEKRITEAIERQILISNQRSFFSQNPGIHYALGVKLYGRFSSPMREIVGVFSHKELAEKFGFQEPLPDEADIELREKVILASNRCKDVQKEIDHLVSSLVLDSIFRPELPLDIKDRNDHRGTVMGMKDSRIYVLLDSPRIEVKVYTEDLERITGKTFSVKFYEMVEDGTAGQSVWRFRAGDEISIKLIEFDERGKWRFAISGMQDYSSSGIRSTIVAPQL